MPRQAQNPDAPVERIVLTPEGKQALDQLRVLTNLPGYSSVTETEVVSQAIIDAYQAQIARLNRAGRGTK